MAKKIHNDEIDESFIIASIKQERKVEPTPAPKLVAPPKPEVKEEIKEEVKELVPEPKTPKKNRGKVEQYEELFFRESSESARSGKGITIRPEFHDNIMAIVQLSRDTQINLFGYIDNILAHHFETYESELDELYSRNYKKPKFLKKKS